MTGHIRRRGKNSWELKFDAGRDAGTGKRVTRYHSVKGTRREAGDKLAALITAARTGSDVEPSRQTVADYLIQRLAQWQASNKISAKTAERYGELIENQIVPHLGAKQLQKLKAI